LHPGSRPGLALSLYPIGRIFFEHWP